MISVLIGTNTNRKRITIDPARTIKDVLEENAIDYSTGGIHLNGLAIGGGDLEKSFTAHGITEDCILISVVKGDGGVM